MTITLRDRVAVVTGGAQGIGWAIAQALADYGARVHLCDIDEESLSTASRLIPDLPWSDRLSVVRCDVTEHTEVLDWIAAIRREEGTVDILVNNAAFVNWKSAQEMSVEAAIRSMEVGYHGMVYTIKAVLPDMLEAGWGRIVNMGSSAGRIFVGSASAAYAGAKAAIGGYTQMLQLELRGAPVRVTLVRPGAVAGTNFFRKYVSSSQLPRLGDFLPYLVPSQVAHHVVRAIKRGTPIVDIPGYMPLFYFFFDVAPGLLRRVMRLGGPGRRDYGQVAWTYDPYLSSQEE